MITTSRESLLGADVKGPPLVVGIGGALNPRSNTEKAIAAVLANATDLGAQTMLFAGEALNLPLYGRFEAARSPAASALVAAMRQADALVLASPSYHGGISGVVKNAIDYAEELRSDAPPYLDERAVGCIATGGGWQGAVITLNALRNVVHTLRGWNTPLGVVINTSEERFDDAGRCSSSKVEEQLRAMAQQLVEFAIMRRARAGVAAP
jgi:FMN reductase